MTLPDVANDGPQFPPDAGQGVVSGATGVVLSGGQEASSHVKFRDGNRSEHVRAFLAWLPEELRDAPGIVWEKLPSAAMRLLVVDVAASPDAGPIALAVGILASGGRLTRAGTITHYARQLVAALRAIRDASKIEQVDQLGDPRVWERFLATAQATSGQQHKIRTYICVTTIHVPIYLRSLTIPQRAQVAHLVLPPPPPSLITVVRPDLNFRDGDHAAHVDALYELLPDALRTAPNIDWASLSSEVLALLIRTVSVRPYAGPIMLAAGIMAPAIESKTLRSRVVYLHKLLGTLFNDCGVQHMPGLRDRQVWDCLVTTVTSSAYRTKWLDCYRMISEKYVPTYVEDLEPAQCAQLQPYILPPLPRQFIAQHGHMKAHKEAEQERRKALSDVLAPLVPVLVALVLARKRLAHQLIERYRQERQRVLTGEVPLPHQFVCDLEVQELSQDARSVADVRMTVRSVQLCFEIYDPDSWIVSHPSDYTAPTVDRHARRPVLPRADELFLQFHGSPSDLLWFGDLVDLRLFQYIKSDPTNPMWQRRATAARAWGAHRGIVVKRPGLLRPAGRLQRWLGRRPFRADELLFEPEALYRGILYGAALALIVLTNGARVGELLQISLDRFCTRAVPEVQDGVPTGKITRMVFQQLLPKGAQTGVDRQLFPLSPESVGLLEEITETLYQTHGTIPVIAPNPNNHKYEYLGPERYLFQWAAQGDGRLGLLAMSDVPILLRLVFHNFTMYTENGEPIKITTHVLRHVMAQSARHEFGVPAEVVARVLHHSPEPSAATRSSPRAPAITHYYGQKPENDAWALLHAYQREIEDYQPPLQVVVPDADQLATWDAQAREVLALWHTLNPTLFGYCGNPQLCPRGNQRALCIGCRFLIPNPDKIDLARQWERQYTAYAQELRAANSYADAVHAEHSASELRDLINGMCLVQQAMERQNYIPLYCAPDVRTLAVDPLAADETTEES